MSKLESTSYDDAMLFGRIQLILYKVDVQLNEATKSASNSFSKSSQLFKGIFLPLQKHIANSIKVRHLSSLSKINTDIVKENLTSITGEIQFHDVIEQRLKHIRIIHNEIIQDIIETKKNNKKRDDVAYIRSVAQINAAQVSQIADEYSAFCKKMNESLTLIRDYIISWQEFSNANAPSASTIEVQFFIGENDELCPKIISVIDDFLAGCWYRSLLTKPLEEIYQLLNSLADEIQVKEKPQPFHEKLKRLRDLYTTSGERAVFNKLVSLENRTLSYKQYTDGSGVDFF